MHSFESPLRSIVLMALAGIALPWPLRALQLREGRGAGPPEARLVETPWARTSRIAGLRVESIDAIARTPNGFVLLDRASQRVVRLSDGGPEEVLATAGQGPREISPGVRNLLVRADTIFVPDLAQARVLRFVTDGRALEPLQFTASGLPVTFGFDSNGSLIAVIRPLRNRNGRGAFLTTLEVRRIGALGGNPVAKLVLNAHDSIESVKALSPSPSVAILPNGSFLAASGREPLLGTFRTNGALDRWIKLETSAPGLSRDDATLLLSSALTSVPLERREDLATSLLNRLGVEGDYPHFSSIMAEGMTRIWLRRPLTASDARKFVPVGFDLDNLGSNDWSVADSTGRIAFVVRIPQQESLRWIRGDTLVVSRLLPEGNATLVRYVLQLNR